MTVERIHVAGITAGPDGTPTAVVTSGARTVYFTGHIGVDATGELVGDTLGDQAVQVLRNLEMAATAAGVDGADIAHVRFHVVADDFETALAELQSAVATYAQQGGPLIGAMPATTMVAVHSLHLGALIEVDMVAVLDD